MEKAIVNERKILIQGENANIIPAKNVDCDYMIEKGSHMMALTGGEELSLLINEMLLQE